MCRLYWDIPAVVATQLNISPTSKCKRMHESGCWGSLLKQPAVNPRGRELAAWVLTHGKRMVNGLFKSMMPMKSIGIPMAGLILNSSESFVHWYSMLSPYPCVQESV